MGGGSSKHRVAKTASKSTLETGPPSLKPQLSVMAVKLQRWQGETRCDPGFGSDEDENQDVVSLQPLDDCGAVVVSIFDGHGPAGREVALACQSHIATAVRAHLPAAGESGSSVGWLDKCFESLESHVRASVPALSESGATATVLVYLPERKVVLSANVGDSKAIIADAHLSPQPLTVDHLPTAEAERQRILSAGGRVAPSDDVQLGTLGEVRVWKGASSSPGLTITRSIGDSIAKECGVISKPSSMCVELSQRTGEEPGAPRMLIAGSAGIWKVFSPKELVELISMEGTLAAAADKIISEARNRWEELWQGENTSLVVFALPT